MSKPLDHLKVAHRDLELAKDMKEALTARTLIFDDGANQTFTSDGKTTYVEHAGATRGEWSIAQDGPLVQTGPAAADRVRGDPRPGAGAGGAARRRTSGGRRRPPYRGRRQHDDPAG